MMMRDKAIISDLQRFRCMTREQISELHFGGVKNKVNESNRVLLRLKREGHIAVSKERRMYTYFPARHIKKDSNKLNHFLAIVDFYCDICKHAKPARYDVEPKIGDKGYPEPDVFMIWRNTPFFVEVQQSDYSNKQWQEKLNRYDRYLITNDWHNFDWQPKDKKIQPMLWVVGKGPGVLPNTSFRIFHTSVDDMVKRIANRK